MSDDREALKARFGTFSPSPSEHAVPEDAKPVIHTTEVMSPNEPVMRKGFDEIKLKVRRNQKTIGLGPLLRPSGDVKNDFAIIRDFYKDKVGKFPEKQSTITLRDREAAILQREINKSSKPSSANTQSITE